MASVPRTHLGISPRWVGVPGELLPGQARARLDTHPEMAADERGLVHGGFTFGLADYAAMLAVNEPHVVLGGSSCRFLRPVRVGERLEAIGTVKEAKGKKRLVEVKVFSGDSVVLEGELTCFVLEHHVLDP
jgi:acyl-coenzyme A thioesterase PaaI-like protein